MKTTLIATTLVILAAGATANNCKEGLYYCGQTLLDIGKKSTFKRHSVKVLWENTKEVLYIIGNYQPQIDQAIFDASQQEIDNGKEDLFFCDGGDNGIINWTTRCSGGCVDAGPGNSDHC
jgi:hypothetical protein